MFNQKIIALFIHRNTFQFFGGAISGVFTVEVPSTVLRDIDVVNKDALYILIKQWVTEHALSDGHIVIVLSDADYFEKIISAKESVQMESDVLKFFDSIPFESSLTKVYPHEQGKRAIAVNNVLCETLSAGFALQGVNVKGIVPAFVLGEQKAKHSMDAEMAQYIMKNMDMYLKQNMMNHHDVHTHDVQYAKTESTTVPPKQKSKLPMLLGVFGVLIAIMLFLLLR